MYETWRFIFVVALVIIIGMLLPFAVEASPVPADPQPSRARVKLMH